MSVESAVDIAMQVSQGLAKAHEKGIVHRDIKPGNVVLTKDGLVKIIDFGLAKLIGSKSITRSSSTLGTVAYMSPEQIEGQNVDHRSDIWSLGVVLYEMLTGQLPFKGESDPPVIYSILNEDPEPITTHRSDVPVTLERMVGKAMQKDRNERYRDLEELITDLRFLKSDSESKGILTKMRATKKVPRKRAYSLVLATVMVVTAILTMFGYFFFFRQQQKNNIERIPILVVDVVNETKEEELDGLSGMFITSLEQSHRLSVLTRSRMFDILAQFGKEDISIIDERLGKEISKRANVNTMAIASIRKFGRIYTIDIKLLDLEEKRYLLTAKEQGAGLESIPDLIDRLAETIRRGLNEEETEIQAANLKVADVITPNLEAYQHYFQGEHLLNKLNEQKAQKEFEKAIELDSTFGLAYYRLAQTLAWYFGDESLAKEPMQKALALIDRMPEKDRYLVRAQQARYEKGFEAAITILKEMEQTYPDDEQMLYDIGHASFWSGQYQVAAKYFDKVLEANPGHELALDYLTRTFEQMEWYEKMLEAAKRYVSVSRSARSYLFLASSLTKSGKYENALQTLEQAHQLFPEDYEIVDGIADFYMFQENYENAEAELMTLVEESQPPEARLLGYFSLSYLYPYMGRYQESLKYIDKITDIYWENNDINNATTQQMRKASLLLWGWNNLEQALQEVEKTYPLQDRIRSRHYWPYLAGFYVFIGKYALADSLARAISKKPSLPKTSPKLTSLQWYHSYITALIQYANNKCDQGQDDALFNFLEHTYPHLGIS
ncbi:MAG: protein kinase, partial [bacterium]